MHSGNCLDITSFYQEILVNFKLSCFTSVKLYNLCVSVCWWGRKGEWRDKEQLGGMCLRIPTCTNIHFLYVITWHEFWHGEKQGLSQVMRQYWMGHMLDRVFYQAYNTRICNNIFCSMYMYMQLLKVLLSRYWMLALIQLLPRSILLNVYSRSTISEG